MSALKNSKWEAFAQAVALNMPAGQAYAEYVSGGKCSESTAETTGPKLARKSQIALRISELRARVGKAADKKFDMTKETWLEELREIATEARNAEDFSAATGALREIGKGAGHYAPEKVEHSGATEIVIRKL
jgi:predicted DNA-binding protein